MRIFHSQPHSAIQDPQAPASASHKLCTECGLCCSGALFVDVELDGAREALAMEAMGLEVDEENGHHLLLQPCRALHGTQCRIYPHRPDCCRRFECALLIRHRNDELTTQDALAHVEQLKHLLETGQTTEANLQIDQLFLTPPRD